MPNKLGSENVFPILRVLEDATPPSTPPTGQVHFYVDEATKTLHGLDDADVDTDYGAIAAGHPLNNYAATAAPAVTDDDGDGYEVGSVWIDVTGDAAYICVDASTGAAVWLPFDSASGESWEGAWSAGTYTTGQIVEHNDVIYQANTSTTDEPPSADWDVLYTAPAGGGPMLLVDDIALDAAGDDFGSGMGGWSTGGSPSASSTITTEPYDDTCIDLTFPSQFDRYYKAIDSGDWTYYLTIYGSTNGTPSAQGAMEGMLSLCALDNSGNGTGMSIYNDGNVYLWVISSHGYSSTGPIIASNFTTVHPYATSGWPVVYRLSKSGTTIEGAVSFNGGAKWLTNTRTDSTTFTRIAIARIWSGGGTNPTLRVGRFNLIP
jgi:hypothetical protein